MKRQRTYGMLIDLDKCTGCYACQVTCKAEYDIPYGTFRCRLETYRSGNYPDVKKYFLPRLCNHCDNAPCIESCEERALYKNQDGVVLINSGICSNCGKCYEKCPYNAIEISQYTGQVEKCDFCYDRRIVKGLLPVCVESCMGKAFTFGDINDEESVFATAMENNRLKVLKPELGTNPSVFYVCKGVGLNGPLKDYKIAEKAPRTQRISTEKEVVREFPDAPGAKMIYTSDAMCPSECGIVVLVENGRAKKIYGNPHTLINNGALCAKGASGLQLTYSPHRIKTPLMRAGRRGEDKWKEVTWKEAADHIAKKLTELKQRYGPESVFFDGGDVTDREAYYRLFHAFGTPNVYNHGSICDSNRRWGQAIMTGDDRPLPDVQRPLLMNGENGIVYLNREHDAGLIMNVGVNPFVATRFNYMSFGIPAAKEKGCVYIVVDPSHTNSAAHADMWLPINPGTDAALLASMLYLILHHDDPDAPERRYIDHDFIRGYTTGWDEFKREFLAYAERVDPSNNLYYFTPEWAEEKTGIGKAELEKVAHLFGITKPAAIEIGMHGTAHHANGDVTSILMTALCLITGNMDKPGGMVFIDSQKVKKGDKTAAREFLEKKVVRQIGGSAVTGRLAELNKDLYGDYPASWKGVLSDLPDKIGQGITLRHGTFKGYHYPVKAFISRAGNPVMTAGNTSDWIGALTLRGERRSGGAPEYSLELMVFMDTHINVTGRYADVILPEAGFLERMGLSDVYTLSPEVAIRDKVIEPLYGSKTPFDFMIAMSESLIENGDPDIKRKDFKWKYKNEEDFINEILTDSPGFYNIGKPLPYPDLPEGCLITGTPDNPTAVKDGQVIKSGERLTVDWLRKHHGVAVWPASYYRYKKSDGSPSGIYPRTLSKKFEFMFSYLENINRNYGTKFPVTFYWSECRWNPKSLLYKEMSREYPFQLISGRVHYSMTMTGMCPYLAETETECMKPLNNDFHYSKPENENISETYLFPGSNAKAYFRAGSVSIPVFAMNRNDGERLHVKTGDVIALENPQKKKIMGKAYLTEEIMPGVIKTAFGPGGQRASGMGFLNHVADYTPNINELYDPKNMTGFTGMPGFGDIMVKVIREKE